MQILLIGLLIVGFLFYGKMAAEKFLPQEDLPVDSTGVEFSAERARELQEKKTAALNEMNDRLQQDRLDSYGDTGHFDNQ